jgi:hypothetical protein
MNELLVLLLEVGTGGPYGCAGDACDAVHPFGQPMTFYGIGTSLRLELW